jgi:hypothetical protein
VTVIGGKAVQVVTRFEREVPEGGRQPSAELQLAPGVEDLDAGEAVATDELGDIETAPARAREIGKTALLLDPCDRVREVRERRPGLVGIAADAKSQQSLPVPLIVAFSSTPGIRSAHRCRSRPTGTSGL